MVHLLFCRAANSLLLLQHLFKMLALMGFCLLHSLVNDVFPLVLRGLVLCLFIRQSSLEVGMLEHPVESDNNEDERDMPLSNKS